MTPDQMQAALDGKIPFSVALGAPEGMTEIFALLGAQYYDQGRYEDARCMFQGAAALDSSNYYGHAGLGAIALIEEDLEGARVHLLRAYSLNAKDPSVCVNLGEVFLRSGGQAEAARYLREAASLDPEHLSPYANRARGMLSAIES
jgi:Flp pilus assembly protein TadD